MTAPWFVEAFRADYLDVYAHRDDAAAAAEVEFVAGAIGGATAVLDAGCGAGRHARAIAALAAADRRVVGLDLSLDLLHRAVAAGGGVRYACGDLRALPFRVASFDAVVSLFTSFGYFDDTGNRAHLVGLRRVARPGARFVLDFLNASRVRETLVPRSEKRRGELSIVEERAIRGTRVEKDVTIIAASGERRSWRESVRLYDSNELVALVHAAGFSVSSVHGDLRGGEHGAAAPRCVVISEAA